MATVEHFRAQIAFVSMASSTSSEEVVIVEPWGRFDLEEYLGALPNDGSGSNQVASTSGSGAGSNQAASAGNSSYQASQPSGSAPLVGLLQFIYGMGKWDTYCTGGHRHGHATYK